MDLHIYIPDLPVRPIRTPPLIEQFHTARRHKWDCPMTLFTRALSHKLILIFLRILEYIIVVSKKTPHNIIRAPVPLKCV